METPDWVITWASIQVIILTHSPLVLKTSSKFGQVTMVWKYPFMPRLTLSSHPLLNKFLHRTWAKIKLYQQAQQIRDSVKP